MHMNHLKALRRAIRPKVTQEDLAAALGVSTSQYNRHECAAGETMSGRQIILAAKALGVTPNDILGVGTANIDVASRMRAAEDQVAHLLGLLEQLAVREVVYPDTGLLAHSCTLCSRMVSKSGHAEDCVLHKRIY